MNPIGSDHGNLVVQRAPGLSVSRSPHPDGDEDRRRQARTWCERLWGDRAGWAITARGVAGYLDDAGRYKFGRRTERAYRWPDEHETLLDRLLDAGERDDDYAGVLLRSAGARREDGSEPLSGSVA